MLEQDSLLIQFYKRLPHLGHLSREWFERITWRAINCCTYEFESIVESVAAPKDEEIGDIRRMNDLRFRPEVIKGVAYFSHDVPRRNVFKKPGILVVDNWKHMQIKHT